MSGFDSVHNGGARGRSHRALGNTTATAGGAGDNVAANTNWQGRKGSLGIANSAKLIVSYSAVLAAGATLRFTAQFQDAVDAAGTGAANYGESNTSIVATGNTGGSTEASTAEFDIDLGGAREFIRAVITPDLSASGTDTLAFSAVWMFYGQQKGPQTKATANLASADNI